MMTILLWILGAGRSIVAWFKALPWQAKVAIATVLLGLFAWHLHSNAERRANDAAFNAGWTAHAKVIDAAQAKEDEAQRHRVKVQTIAQTMISTETTHALLDRNAATDARAADLLRAHEEARHRDRASGTTNPGPAGTSAGGACPPPAESGLAWEIAFPLMVQAQKNEDQLNALLDWEEKQDALDAKIPTE